MKMRLWILTFRKAGADPQIAGTFNLSFDGVFKTPTFICENNRKSNKIMHCVDLFFFNGSFEDMGIFTYST